MHIALLFLVALLAVVVALNWRTLFGTGRPCDWSRIHPRDRDGRRAWFCTACGREELVNGKDPPTVCGAKSEDQKGTGT